MRHLAYWACELSVNNNQPIVLPSCTASPAKLSLGGLVLGEEAPLRPAVSGTETQVLVAPAQWQDQTSQRPRGLL